MKSAIIVLFIFLPGLCFSTEFRDLKSYQQVYPAGKMDGNDGHWLKQDRLHHTIVWTNANLTNLSSYTGYLQYHTINQRYAFLRWLKFKTTQNKSNVRWPKAAVLITSYLKKICGPFAFTVGCDKKEIRYFAEEGNAMVFKTLWSDFAKITVEAPHTDVAKDLDLAMLAKEQQAIQPFFDHLTRQSIKRLQKLVWKENFITSYLPGPEFIGDLKDQKCRFNHGLKLMGYAP